MTFTTLPPSGGTSGGHLKGDSDFDLKLKPQQLVALVALQVVGLTIHTFDDAVFGDNLRAALTGMTKAALGPTECPFGSPPASIIQDFDSQKNMFLHCLHGNRHCWTLNGSNIQCP